MTISLSLVSSSVRCRVIAKCRDNAAINKVVLLVALIKAVAAVVIVRITTAAIADIYWVFSMCQAFF